MSHTKKILAAAIVSGLFATSAQAQVVLSAIITTPVLYAQEIVASTGSPVTLAAITANELQSALLYNFSANEVRHARVACSANMLFDPAAAVTLTGGGTAGAINGAGTNVIWFSLTSNAVTPFLLATDTITINGARQITAASAVNCSYSLHDTPSQAASGVGGLVVSTASRPYLAFGPSYRLVVTSPRTSIADVETVLPNPVFGDFVANAPTTLSTAALATVLFDVQPVTSQPRLPNGTVIAVTADLGFILGSTTSIRVNATNDGFSAAANAALPFYTGGTVLNRVYLSSSAVACTFGTPASSLSATLASFTVGSTVPVPIAGGALLCLARLAGNTIPVSDFTTGLNAVAASVAYAPQHIAAVGSGNIVRNGTQLQAPLAQVPAGWLSRIALTNTGNLARPYTITVFGETGNVITTNPLNMSGTVPALGTRMINMNDVLTSFTGNTRATVNVTIAGPNEQIQGLYQIVNPAAGSLSNHVMVRPGSN